MTREEKWRMTYKRTDGTVLRCYPSSREQIARNREVCKERGFEVLEVVKLYPFSTMKNQHNFSLINDITAIELYDIWNGEKKVSDEEYERLVHQKERAEYFFCLPLPVAWLPYPEWCEAKEMAMAAVLHRQEACIRNGRPDLVTYC